MAKVVVFGNSQRAELAHFYLTHDSEHKVAFATGRRLWKNGLYRMWYCFRGSADYRTDKAQSYRLGYAESHDGVRWQRLDDLVGIERSSEGWDSQMMEYPFVYEPLSTRMTSYSSDG